MKSKRLKTLALGLVIAALAGAPAHAVPDEGGGAASSTAAPQLRVDGFDWSDAGIGIGIGVAAGVVAVGSTLAMRRRRPDPASATRPAAG
ncbi:MAG: hypothetical protein ACRDM0_23010 [Thermoleophilaceae bacterium]